MNQKIIKIFLQYWFFSTLRRANATQSASTFLRTVFTSLTLPGLFHSVSTDMTIIPALGMLRRAKEPRILQTKGD